MSRTLRLAALAALLTGAAAPALADGTGLLQVRVRVVDRCEVRVPDRVWGHLPERARDAIHQRCSGRPPGHIHVGHDRPPGHDHDHGPHHGDDHDPRHADNGHDHNPRHADRGHDHDPRHVDRGRDGGFSRAQRDAPVRHTTRGADGRSVLVTITY